MSIKSVASIVRACGFAYRRLRRRQVSSRPAAASQEMDMAFRETFTRAMGEGRCIIAFDESGFDHRVVPLYGYAPRGSPAVGKYAALTDNKRHNLLLAVRSNGDTVRHEVIIGTVVASDVVDFVNAMECPKGSLLLMDNAPIHTTRAVAEALVARGIEPLFTPPYSPALNPVELLFAEAKRHFRNARVRLPMPFQKQKNQNVMGELVEHAVQESTRASSVIGSFRHVSRVIRERLDN